ncbi:tRNA(ANN) t(6)A37 threonylcarbamoyladenosine modification protein [Mannheimia granulomatis]|uniref:Threonylcarbamoyl-AMP synthase n=1 Tax=Mannheimia granulomatis TaxID=85402 RepID=A0A011LZ80_9PAST|nr:Sua5/YciO/YrdC/YwlC family protein [Mannheimia granulomatis]EXI62533.1 tRNA(ANN) t(6)A37 threonylcarbamoyladenosine modification protein [Mannheimia granulomatis]RGE47838.1 tRNA(ANN) t(6)A37 threonylcarbamoyladenosine modification protein [Mannheimia granulomatis]
MNNFLDIVNQLKQEEVVAYPTEAVFGLGCNPQSEKAVRKLLQLKQRPEEKGLILLASKLSYLLPYIDESKMNESAWQQLVQVGEQAITWVVPAKESVPAYLRGKFDSVAVRLCHLPAVVKLCEATGFALTSTSANLSGLPPCRTALEVKKQFGDAFPVLNAPTFERENPSEIRDIFSQQIFRQG